ncbi:unnamed protein product [Coregonus sp. 'balchen']|nr:unnamed protein product [Coregonus sp. 'balchen']
MFSEDLEKCTDSASKSYWTDMFYWEYLKSFSGDEERCLVVANMMVKKLLADVEPQLSCSVTHFDLNPSSKGQKESKVITPIESTPAPKTIEVSNTTFLSSQTFIEMITIICCGRDNSLVNYPAVNTWDSWVNYPADNTWDSWVNSTEHYLYTLRN